MIKICIGLHSGSMSEPASIPNLVPIGDALEDSNALRDLQRRLQRSRECLAAVRSILPASLAEEIGLGAWDEAGWTMTVRSSAVAAKLRHWVPEIESALLQRGLKVNAIRIKVQPARQA
jgi:hypothetical protein